MAFWPSHQECHHFGSSHQSSPNHVRLQWNDRHHCVHNLLCPRGSRRLLRGAAQREPRYGAWRMCHWLLLLRHCAVRLSERLPRRGSPSHRKALPPGHPPCTAPRELRLVPPLLRSEHTFGWQTTCICLPCAHPPVCVRGEGGKRGSQEPHGEARQVLLPSSLQHRPRGAARPCWPQNRREY